MIDSYYDGSDILPDLNTSTFDYARISPSSVAKFFSHPRSWWGENFLGEPGFEGSTSTVLGTIVHSCIEAHVTNTLQPTKADVEDYLAKQSPDIDCEVVRDLWRSMADVLIEGCGSTRFESAEEFIHYQILPGVFVAGTYDLLRPTSEGSPEPDYYIEVL